MHLKGIWAVPIIASILIIGTIGLIPQSYAGVNPCYIVQNIDSQLSSANHKLQILANNPADTQPATLNTINIKLGQLTDRMDKVDPAQSDDLQNLAADLGHLISTAEITQTIAVEFPNPNKDKAVAEQLGLIGANAQELIDKTNEILIGL